MAEVPWWRRGAASCDSGVHGPRRLPLFHVQRPGAVSRMWLPSSVGALLLPSKVGGTFWSLERSSLHLESVCEIERLFQNSGLLLIASPRGVSPILLTLNTGPSGASNRLKPAPDCPPVLWPKQNPLSGDHRVQKSSWSLQPVCQASILL